MTGRIEVTYGLAYGPQVMVSGVSLKPSLERLSQHTVGDACWIADAQHVDSTVTEFLRYPIHGHVALGTHQNLRLAVQRLVDGLHQRGGLACARRTMHHGHVLGPQYLVDSLFLGGVEPGETLWQEGEAVGGGRGVADVAQFGQTVALGLHDTVQGLEHQAVGRFVEGELNAQPVGSLQLQERIGGGQHHDHPVLFHITHLRCKLHVVQQS